MFRFKLYILLLLTTSIKCVILKHLPKCKILFSFINNSIYNKNFLYNKKFYNNYYDKENQCNNNLNKYTLNNNFVLYSKKPKEDKKEPNPVKKSTKKNKKKSVLTPESIQEPELNIKNDLENDFDLELKPKDSQSFVDLNENDSELSISKRMLGSVTSLTSSFYQPNLYDIIPILYNIKADVLNITENIGDQFKQTAKVLDKKNKITGLFTENDEGTIEQLLLSIPSSILDRLSQSSKYASKVEFTESPVQLISLGPGFFSKVYQMAIFPYLSEVSQKAFDTKLDHSHGFMEYIVSAPTYTKNYKEYDFNDLKAVSKEEFETAFKNYRVHRVQDFDINLLQENTKKSLSVLIKCVKDFVYFNSCILLLEKLLGREPTDREILYSFQSDPFRDTKNIGDEQNKKTLKENKNKNKDKNNKKQDEINYYREMRNKLVDIINYSENEIECRIDRFFTPFIEVVIDRFEKKVAKRSYYLRILVGCLKDGLQGIRSRLYGVYPNIIMHLENNFIGQLFKIAYHQVRTSAIKQNLPMHLPLSTLRLAKRAFVVYDYMEYMQYDTILKYKNKLIDPENLPSIDSFGEDVYLGVGDVSTGSDGDNKDNKEKQVENVEENKQEKQTKENKENKKDKSVNRFISIKTKRGTKYGKVKDKDKVDIDDKVYKEFVSEIIKIESKFNSMRGNKETKDIMRKQQQDKLLDETVAKVLKVSVDRLKEAIDSYNTREVGPRDKMPKHLRMRYARNNKLFGNTGRYSDLSAMNVYDENSDLDFIRENVYTKTLRKLAIEAIEDRLTRLLYMSHNNLFLDINPEYEELIEHLEIPKETADFIVFTASLICREYEYWRIKLNLPPYVNEFKVHPGLISNAKLDVNDLPYHISTTIYNNLKYSMKTPDANEIIPHSSKKPKKDKRDSYNRRKLIKPKMSSINDLLMNYKKNYKEYERTLKKSPIVYLKPTGIYEEH